MKNREIQKFVYVILAGSPDAVLGLPPPPVGSMWGSFNSPWPADAEYRRKEDLKIKPSRDTGDASLRTVPGLPAGTMGSI